MINICVHSTWGTLTRRNCCKNLRQESHPSILLFNGRSVEDYKGFLRGSGIRRRRATHSHRRLRGTFQEMFAWLLRGAGVDESQNKWVSNERRKGTLSSREKRFIIVFFTLCALRSITCLLNLAARDSPNHDSVRRYSPWQRDPVSLFIH